MGSSVPWFVIPFLFPAIDPLPGSNREVETANGKVYQETYSDELRKSSVEWLRQYGSFMSHNKKFRNPPSVTSVANTSLKTHNLSILLLYHP